MTSIAKKDLPDNIKRFLMLITFTEGTDRQGTPYNELFGFDNFTGYDKHPRILVKKGGLKSTAAGRYQMLYGTWLDLKRKKIMTGFTPIDQDAGAAHLLKEQGAYKFALAGEWEKAIGKVNDIWASLPGSPYGQPRRKLADCLTFLNTVKI